MVAMRKVVVTLLTCMALSSTAHADPYECTELQNLWGIASAAQDAENGYNYWYRLDQNQQGWYQCQALAQRDASPAHAMRACEDDYQANLNEIENEYQALHNEALISNQAYYDYLNYVISQGIQCQI